MNVKDLRLYVLAQIGPSVPNAPLEGRKANRDFGGILISVKTKVELEAFQAQLDEYRTTANELCRDRLRALAKEQEHFVGATLLYLIECWSEGIAA